MTLECFKAILEIRLASHKELNEHCKSMGCSNTKTIELDGKIEELEELLKLIVQTF